MQPFRESIWRRQYGALDFGTLAEFGKEVQLDGRLYLAVNDDYFADKVGEFRATVSVS